jgi:hypothetical protein
MDQRLKDKRDAHRFRAAVRRGLDLGTVLEVVFGGRDEALSGKRVGAAAALRRLERAVRLGRVRAKARGRKHLALSLLKGLVGEGYLRVERLELKPHQKRQELKAVPDPRLAGTAYRITRKGRALLEALPAAQPPNGPLVRPEGVRGRRPQEGAGAVSPGEGAHKGIEGGGVASLAVGDGGQEAPKEQEGDEGPLGSA